MKAISTEIKSKHYIQNLIDEGEHVHQDFKYKISDARKIARSISAFANHDGGRLLVGVKDNGKVVGIDSDEEIYMIEQAAEMYCRPSQEVTCQVYRVEGKMVLEVKIPKSDSQPVKAPDENGNWKTYFRVADENVLASPLHFKVMQNRKSGTEIVVEYTRRENELIQFIQDKEFITVDDFATMSHISHKLAESIIIKLCSIGTLDFEYQYGKCVIVIPKTD